MRVSLAGCRIAQKTIKTSFTFNKAVLVESARRIMPGLSGAG
jgi:hypothetical protein